MQYISLAHSWFRWVVLAAGLVTAGKQTYNLLTKRSYQDQDKLLLTVFIRTLEIEAGLGSILIISEIILRDASTSTLIHGLVGLIPLGLAYLLESREIIWAKKDKAYKMLLGASALIILIMGVSYFSPEQPAAEELFILSGHQEAVRSVEFSPDQKTLASGSFDGTIRIWDLASGEEELVISTNKEPIRDISYSDDGKSISAGSFDHHLSIWSLPDGDSVLDIPAHQASINKVIWSGDRIYTTSLDDTIRVWDPGTGELVKQIENDHSGGILSLALSADGQTLASGGIDGTIRLYDIQDDSSIYLGDHASWVYDLDYSSNGELLASASLDGTVIVWDLSTQSMLFQSDNLGEAIQTVAFSPDSSILLGGSADSNVYCWDVKTHKLIDTFQGHQRGILDLDFSSDGKYFASASADNTVIIWQMTHP